MVVRTCSLSCTNSPEFIRRRKIYLDAAFVCTKLMPVRACFYSVFWFLVHSARLANRLCCHPVSLGMASAQFKGRTGVVRSDERLLAGAS